MMGGNEYKIIAIICAKYIETNICGEKFSLSK